MEKPVIISIKSTQNMDGQEDTIELVTQGVLRHSEEEGFALVYPPFCGRGPSTPR